MPMNKRIGKISKIYSSLVYTSTNCFGFVPRDSVALVLMNPESLSVNPEI